MVSTWMGDHSKDLEAVAITTVKSKKRRKLPPLHDSGAKERKKKKKTPHLKIISIGYRYRYLAKLFL